MKVTVSVLKYDDFCKLPVEDTSTQVEATKENKLRENLEVCFSRVNVKAIYGSKKLKIDRNEDHVKLVPVFLQRFFDLKHEDDEESSKTETFEQWRDRLALAKVQTTIFTDAKRDAISTVSANLDNLIARGNAMAESGAVDNSTVAEFEKMLATMKAKLAEQEKLLKEQAEKNKKSE